MFLIYVIVQVRLAELAKEAARLAELKRQQAEREIAHKLLLKQQEEAREEARKQAKIRTMGLCSAGFEWIKVSGGYQCKGGSHYISDQDLN